MTGAGFWIATAAAAPVVYAHGKVMKWPLLTRFEGFVFLEQSGYAQYHDQLIKVINSPYNISLLACVVDACCICDWHTLNRIFARDFVLSRRATGRLPFTASSSCGASVTPTTTVPTFVSSHTPPHPVSQHFFTFSLDNLRHSLSCRDRAGTVRTHSSKGLVSCTVKHRCYDFTSQVESEHPWRGSFSGFFKEHDRHE